MRKLKFLIVFLLLLPTTYTLTSTQESLKVSDKTQQCIDQLSNVEIEEDLTKLSSEKDSITCFPIALWTKTLNFFYEYYDKNENLRKITTGKGGNTYLVSGEPFLSRTGLNELFSKRNNKSKAKTKKLTPKQLAIHDGKFDIDYIHEKLQEEETEFRPKKSKSNYVVAGVSLLFETHDSNQYEAIFSFYRRLQENKKPTSSTIYGFESGQYDKTTLQTYYEWVGAVYEKENETSSLSPKKLWDNYDERWGGNCPKVIENLKKETNNQKKKIKEDVNKQLEEMTEFPLNKIAEDINRTILSGYFGAITDSEQVFLYHALYIAPPVREIEEKSNEITPNQESLPKPAKSFIEDQFSQLVTTDYSNYKEESAIEAAILRNSSQTKDEITISNKTIKKCEVTKKRSIVGLIIHIHTTRELCQSCAYSLGNELSLLYKKEQNKDSNKSEGILRLQETMKKYNKDKVSVKSEGTNSNNKNHTVDNPFITFMVSCGEKIESNKQTNHLHPCGVPKDWTLEKFKKTNKETEENNEEEEKKEEITYEDKNISEKQNELISLKLLVGGYFLQKTLKKQSA